MLNNENMKTKSNKFKKISGLCDFACRKIDESQNIKRFLKYQTKSPLSQSSIDLSGDVIVQPDILESLEEINIFNEMFYENMISDARNYIFIYSPYSKFKGVTGMVRLNIDILTAVKYNKLKYGEETRINQIANYISDMFDGYTIENDFITEIIGSPKMEIVGDKQYRLSKTNDYKVFSIEIDIDILCGRSKV